MEKTIIFCDVCGADMPKKKSMTRVTDPLGSMGIVFTVSVGFAPRDNIMDICDKCFDMAVKNVIDKKGKE